MTTSNLLKSLDRIDHVIIEKRLGTGGQAQVYLGAVLAAGMKQPGADSPRIALKVMHLKDTGVLFDDEARHLAWVQRNGQAHPNLIHLLEWGSWQPLDDDSRRAESIHFDPVRELRCMALEYLPGPTLEEHRLKTKRLPVLEVARIGTDLLSALSHIHETGLMHLDVNPRNVLFRAHPPPAGWLSRMDEVVSTAVLIDFGISRRLSDPVTMAPGWGAGGYASPEQYAESEQQGAPKSLCVPASDLFSLGVILYECLTGNNPYLTANGVVDMRTYQPGFVPPRLNARALGVPAAMERVIFKCLLHDPQKRYPDARAALAEWLPATQSLTANQRRKVSFKKAMLTALMALMAVLVCALLGLGGSVVMSMLLIEQPTPTPRPTATPAKTAVPMTQTPSPIPRPTAVGIIFPTSTAAKTTVPSPTPRPIPTRPPATATQPPPSQPLPPPPP